MADQNKKGLSLTAMVMGLGAVLFIVLEVRPNQAC